MNKNMIDKIGNSSQTKIYSSSKKNEIKRVYIKYFKMCTFIVNYVHGLINHRILVS